MPEVWEGKKGCDERTQPQYPSVYPQTCRKLLFPPKAHRVHFCCTCFWSGTLKQKRCPVNTCWHKLLLPPDTFTVPTRGWHLMSDSCLVFSILGGLSLSDIIYTFRDNSDCSSGSVGDVGPLCDSRRIHMCPCACARAYTHTRTPDDLLLNSWREVVGASNGIRREK